MQGVKRLLAAGLSAAMLSAVVPATAAPTRERRARFAVRYIVDHRNADGSVPGFSPIGTTADAVVGMVAARRAPRAIGDALDFLESQSASIDTNGEIAKVVMALAAGGRDPRAFAGRDLVQELTASQLPSGQYGPHTTDDEFDAEVLDHALSMLALIAAGASVSQEGEAWLADAQCADGGWQYDDPPGDADNEHCVAGDQDFSGSDTNTTSYAVQALKASPRTSTLATSPFAFFRAARDPVKRGWGFDLTFDLTDATSTALVIQAYAARGRALPDGAMRALVRLQRVLCGENAGGFSAGWQRQDDGSYRRKPIDTPSTVAAVPGLLKRPFPVANTDVTRRAPRAPAC